MAELLLEKEVIFTDDLVRIFGKRPFETETVEVKQEVESKDEVPAKSEKKTSKSADAQKDLNNEGEISTEFA